MDRHGEDDPRHPRASKQPALDNKSAAGSERRGQLGEAPGRAPKEKASSDGSSAAGPSAAPIPSLPKGGGAIRGIGEKFSANPVTGTAQIQIPVAVSPGRAGFQPDLSIAYDSGAGNGPFGHGFHLSVPQITRKTDKGLPTYDDVHDSDVFILSGAEDLVPKRLAASGWQKERFEDGAEVVERYQPRVEGLFARIEKREDKASGNVYWQATTKDNVTSVYGKSEQARIANPEHPRLVFSWLLERTYDDRGNVTVYEYKSEDRANVSATATFEANRHAGNAPIVNRYLKRIRYGNTQPFDATPSLDSAVFEVVFDYGEHTTNAPDEAVSWPCRPDAFSSYRSGFEIRTYRLCRRVLMFHRMAELGETPCLVRSTDLTYAKNPVFTQLIAATHTGYLRDPGTLAYSSKSYPPLEFGYSVPELQTAIQTLEPSSTRDLPVAIQGAYQWLDLDGEALPGVLTQQGDALYYKQNLGGGELAPARVLLRQPSLARLGSSTQQITDLDGDGLKELALFTPPEGGYFDRTADGDFEPMRLFPAQAFIDWSDPNLRHIDLNGDGFEDVLITRADTFVWYPSLAKGGFGPSITFHRPTDEEKGPAVVFADGSQTLFLADMSGDGLTDLVRIRNGSVCYWPNLGFGRFGAKVEMAGEPWFDYPERFDPRRVRLADVDGSGTTDVLYLHEAGLRIYSNQSGNSFAPAVQLPSFPDASDLSSVATVDLLGSGTSCLVWSSSLPGETFRSIRYIDLLGSKKPHLLTFYKNNFGLETRLEYAPSTQFYLADAFAGRPWVTRLHFPVHVLTRVETFDTVSRHRFASTYAYHHGYFDGVEREFRGFGMVEQRDTESFSRFSGAGDLPPPANATDPELHLPPVVIKTWFHNGALNDASRITKAYAHEYYAGDPEAALLPDTVLPRDLSAENLREACRALKGQILRQETYAEDGTPAAPHPYLVSERNYDVRCLQPIFEGKGHGVFFTHPREAIEYHYERNPSDPRVTHALTLDVDDFGTVRRSAAIGYPRRAAHAAFDEQKKTLVTLSETDVAHHAPVGEPSWYRIGVPIEARSYELCGLTPKQDALFSFDAVLEATTAAVPIAYEAVANGTLQKRLLSHSRTLYLRNDLSAPLPLSAIESLALSYQSYAKAFSPALIIDVFQGRATDEILGEGGYLKLPGDDSWWSPSGRKLVAPEQFYLPVTFLDPFGNATSIEYDSAYRLFVTRAVDPVENAVSARYDHRTLAPDQVTDPNGNRSAARFDALGMLIATALMGKEGAGDGDTLDDPTTSLEYDLTQKPAVTHTRARERHGAENARFQESYSYTDGSGHEVMRKVQAEPGDVGVRRWVGTGRTVFDNKGNPVKQYEPYFSPTAAYEDEPEIVESGVTPILHYDPTGRLIRTDLPNGTFSKVEFDPWRETHWDPNDTVLESAWYRERQAPTAREEERRAARLTAEHANTPSVSHLDSLGRPFQTIEDNGPAGKYATHSALDIEGNALEITDARGVVCMRHRFALGGRNLWQSSSDAGARWTLADVAQALLRAWDARGFTRRARYDAARRPTHLFVQPPDSDEFLAERTVYGEALGDAAVTTNHRGRIHQHFDGAGVVTNAAYDFKGNLETSERRLARAYATTPQWSALQQLDTPGDIVSAADPLLEPEPFITQAKHDALNRPISLVTPDQSETKPAYNEAGLLEAVQVRVRGSATWTTFVENIDYDAKGQRESITYGNEPGRHTTTQYTYDPFTFRLARLKTTRDLDEGSRGTLLQSLLYTYDPVGNITEIRDGAQQTVYFDNDVVTPSTAYVYDAIYRLIEATGREQAHNGQNNPQPGSEAPEPATLPHANDLQAVRNYTQSYDYDPVGNILAMAHATGNAGSWTRRYAYDADGTGRPLSNRLMATSVPGDADGKYSEKYTYDAHGNMASMPHLRRIDWDHHDQMMLADKGGGGIVHFSYDAAGERVRKRWVHNGLVEERIYIGGWEIYRKRADAEGAEPSLERETLHVMDGERRIALVETKTIDTETSGAVTPLTVTRFQLGNHLGSAVLEVDEVGRVITCEEYHPYGTTAYSSGVSAAEVSRKRYRYTGKERDEETGLSYHSARYYAAWLGRWTAADPCGILDSPSGYGYVQCRPTVMVDPNGREAQDANAIIAQKSDPQLFQLLKAMSPAQRQTFANSATDRFAVRAWATLNKYDLEIELTLPVDTVTALPNVLTGTAEVGFKGRREAHVETTESGKIRVVSDPTDAELGFEAAEGTLRVVSLWSAGRSTMGRGTRLVDAAKRLDATYQEHRTPETGGGGEMSFEDMERRLDEMSSNRIPGMTAAGLGGGSMRRAKVTGDPGVIIKKARAAMAGDTSAAAELRVAKLLRAEGKDVHLLKARSSSSTPDALVAGVRTDIKRISGLGRNAAGDLAKGVSQVGPGGQVIVVRPESSLQSLAQYEDFVSNFRPQQPGVTFRVINESSLPNLGRR
jgi:RHS repeat-associated protein